MENLYNEFLNESIEDMNTLANSYSKYPIKFYLEQIEKNGLIIEMYCLVDTEKELPILKTEVSKFFVQYIKDNDMHLNCIKAWRYLEGEYVELLKQDEFKNKLMHLENIGCEFIDKEKNEELLENVPYVDYLNGAIVFRKDFSVIGRESSIITNEFINQTNLDAEYLLKVALSEENPYSKTIVKKVTFTNGESNLLAIEKASCILGSSCLLDTNTLEKISNEYDSDLFVAAVSPLLTIVAPESIYTYENFKSSLEEIKDGLNKHYRADAMVEKGFVLYAEESIYSFNCEEKELSEYRDTNIISDENNICYVDFTKKKI
jgi:hypothetical protein